MEGQSHTYLNEMCRVMGEVADLWYNSCKARKARTQQQADYSTTNWSSEEGAQDSKGDEGEMECVGRKRERERWWRKSNDVGGCG